jgi:transketolase
MTGTLIDHSKLLIKARQLRATCVQMAYDGKESHLKGALSCIDILVALYYCWLKVDPVNPKALDRDRFIFSKGHASSALYAVLADRGFFKKELLATYATDDTSLPSHLCVHALPILDCSSGSLGHGLGIAAGRSYALSLDNRSSRVVALLSDGECNEGSTWEAATFAAANKLDNLLAIVDYNGIEALGYSDELMANTDLLGKFISFGWAGCVVNGHDIPEMLRALERHPFEKNKPSVIIAKTKGGAGVSFMENQIVWHYRTPSREDLEKALIELGEIPLHLEQPR